MVLAADDAARDSTRDGASRAAGRFAPLPFNPPLIYLNRAIHYESAAQAAMTAPVLAATAHCETRLNIPTRRTCYTPDLAAEIVETHLL